MYNNFNQGNYYYFVNGIEGAKAFQVGMNQTTMLMDSNLPVCYMKSTNNLGQPTLRCFKLEEVDENTIKTLAVPINHPNENYVSKQDFDKLSAKLEEIYTKLENKQ